MSLAYHLLFHSPEKLFYHHIGTLPKSQIDDPKAIYVNQKMLDSFDLSLAIMIEYVINFDFGNFTGHCSNLTMY